MFVEDTGVVDRLGHFLNVNEVSVVGSFPDATGVRAASHVAGDPYVVGFTVRVVGGVVAIVRKPGRDTSVYAAAAFFNGRTDTFVVGAADVDGVLEGSSLDGELCDEA